VAEFQGRLNHSIKEGARVRNGWGGLNGDSTEPNFRSGGNSSNPPGCKFIGQCVKVERGQHDATRGRSTPGARGRQPVRSPHHLGPGGIWIGGQRQPIKQQTDLIKRAILLADAGDHSTLKRTLMVLGHWHLVLERITALKKEMQE